MSTLSQFFNNDTVSSTGITSFVGSSKTVSIPSTAKYIGYGVIGAGGGAFCYSSNCFDPGNNGSGNSGGGFSWWEGNVNCASPFNLTVTIGTSTVQANGGFSSISGGPTNICATGGCICMGGCGIGGLINTCGGKNGCSTTRNCCAAGSCGICVFMAASSGGGAGGLLGNGGRGCLADGCYECAGGGGYGSGGGGGWPASDPGASNNLQIPIINGVFVPTLGTQSPVNTWGTSAYTLSYNCLGNLSTAKTMFTAQGSGACCAQPAGAGGGGTFGAPAGFGGGSGAQAMCYCACVGNPGCGGGGSWAQATACRCCCHHCLARNAGGNGVAVIEYWNR